MYLLLCCLDCSSHQSGKTSSRLQNGSGGGGGGGNFSYPVLAIQKEGGGLLTVSGCI